jgi:hypothetical protein
LGGEGVVEDKAESAASDGGDGESNKGGEDEDNGVGDGDEDEGGTDGEEGEDVRGGNESVDEGVDEEEDGKVRVHGGVVCAMTAK